MDEALTIFHEEQKKLKGEQKSVRAIAKDKGVSQTTLQRLIDGGISMSSFNSAKRKLTFDEEDIIIQYVLEDASCGFPFSYDRLEKVANSLLSCRDVPGEVVVSTWVGQFLDRHRAHLQTHWSKPLDTSRAKSLNPTIVRHWFEEVVKSFYIDTGILPENTYSMDESGFPPAASKSTRSIGARGTKTQHKQGSAYRENVTALVTICADGSTL